MRLTMDRPPWLGTIRDGVVNNNISSEYLVNDVDLMQLHTSVDMMQLLKTYLSA
jgi:hypothetical protein